MNALPSLAPALSTLAAALRPEALLALAAKGLLITIVAVLADAALRWRSAPAARRHAVWSLALALLLLLPLLSYALPAWPLSLKLPGSPADAAASVAVPSRPVVVTAVATTAPRASGAAAQSASAGRPAETPGRSWWPGTAGVALVWLLVAAALLLRSGVRWWRAGRLLRDATPWTHGPWAEDLEALRHRLGLSRRVRLLASRHPLVPGTWGLLTPALVVPETARSWRAAPRRTVLLHELCHVRRLDWLTHAVGEVACALYWFNPLVWYSARRLDEERERACDEEVVSRGVLPVEYARHLLEVVRGLRLVDACRPMVAFGSDSGLEGRVRRILATVPVPPASRRSLVLTVLATCALVLPLGSLQPWVPAAAAAPPQAWTDEAPARAMKVLWTEGGTRFEAVFKGDAEVNANVSAVERIDPEDTLDVVAKGGGAEHHLEIRGSASGAPQYRFRVDGQEVPFEPEGSRWLAAHLPDIVAETGFGARSHVRQLRARGGIEPVLDEAAHLDYARVKRMYLMELLHEGLAPSDLELVLKRSPRIFSDDADLGNFLAAAAPVYLPRPEARAAFLQASQAITSGDDRAKLLAALTKEEATADPALLRDLITAGSSVHGDSNRAEFLYSISATVLRRPELQPAFLEGVRAIGSEDDLARMVGALLTRNELTLGQDVERALFQAAVSGIHSDTTKTGFLIHVRDRFLPDPALRPIFLQAAGTVRDDRMKMELSKALREGGK